MGPNRICSNCGREVYKGASQCAYCGYPYKGDYIDGKPVRPQVRCYQCGRPLPPGATKCNDCGARVHTEGMVKNSNMRKCPRCNKMIYDYLAICPNCGCNLRDYPRQQSYGGNNYNNPNNLSHADIEQAMEGGMPNNTDAGTIEQINEILHDNGDDMW